MTFSSKVKKELCAHIPEKSCCARAFCFGAACFSCTFTPEKLEIHTESRFSAQFLRTLFGTQGVALQQGSYRVHGRDKLSLATDDADGPAQLAALWQGRKTLREMLVCPGCQGAYLAGAFLCGGFVADPAKEYHLEFISQRPEYLQELADLLSGEGLEPLRTRRNANELVYLRASEAVEDVLTRMGAGHFAMEIMNEKIYKNFRNQANRITNCETANIDKTVAANQRVLQAIRTLQENQLLDTLPDALQAAAKARLEAPDTSLGELAAAMQPPVSKSGLSHRMRRLIELAEQSRK